MSKRYGRLRSPFVPRVRTGSACHLLTGYKYLEYAACDSSSREAVAASLPIPSKAALWLKILEFLLARPMIHYPPLQMLAGSSVSPSCPSVVRPSTDCRRSVVAAEKARPKFSIHSAFPDYRSNCGVAAAFAASAALTWCSASRGGGSRIIPSLSSLRSVASLPGKANRSDHAISLGSLFVPRFPSGVDGRLWDRKSFLRQNHSGPQVCRSRLNLVGPSAAGFGGEKSNGQVGGAERLTLRSSRLGSGARRIVTYSSAAGASAAPSRGPQNFLSTFFANFIAALTSFESRLQSIRIGWLDLLTMLRIVFLAAGVFGAYIASKRAWVVVQAKAAGKPVGEVEGGGEGEEGQGGGGPMQVLARGATCVQSNMGPWSMADMTIGLTAIAKVRNHSDMP